MLSASNCCLRGKASIEIANESGETPLDIAKRLKHTHCEELLTQALSGRFNSHVHVEYEWRLLHEDLDESDDDVDEKLQQPSPNRREDRPVSFYQLGSNQLQPNVASLARDAAKLLAVFATGGGGAGESTFVDVTRNGGTGG